MSKSVKLTKVCTKVASRARATAEVLLLGSFDHLGENVAKVLPGWTKVGRLKPALLTVAPYLLRCSSLLHLQKIKHLKIMLQLDG